MKRLIICADGTWNKPESEGADGGSSTNVLKIMRAIKSVSSENIPQIRYYCQGVGTGNFFDKIKGGAFGVGLSENVIECYRFLANNYNEGDEIYIFGFSRGAFTARSLGGFIGAIGLVHPRDLGTLPEGWAYYRIPIPERDTDHAKAHLGALGERIVDVPIKCIGVWDTVGSLGIPGTLFNGFRASDFQFHDTELGKDVEVALHAVAIDEQRKNFVPTLWKEDKKPSNRVLEQVYFPGVHSNVGGGYPDQGLSDGALAWMIERLQKYTNLDFDREYIRQHVHRNPIGELYDSKGGNILWRLLPGHVRYIPKDAELHESVQDRMDANLEPPYRPPLN
jgi:uncharacterized protein (DUF2235 family)